MSSAFSRHSLAFPQESRHRVIKKKGHTSVDFPMSNTLVLPNITMEDSGQYHCKAELDPHSYNITTANVVVFGKHPNIAVAERNIVA